MSHLLSVGNPVLLNLAMVDSVLFFAFGILVLGSVGGRQAFEKMGGQGLLSDEWVQGH